MVFRGLWYIEYMVVVVVRTESEVRGLVEEAEDTPHGLDEPSQHARHIVRDVLGHVGVVREHERNGAHLGVQERGKALRRVWG